MINQYKSNSLAKGMVTLLLIPVLFSASIKGNDRIVKIYLRGVYESKISLLPLAGENALKPVIIIDSIQNGETTKLHITDELLPGEFVLRFDYKENAESSPYPSEKRIIINDQDLELWVHPVYCNNADSTWFQDEERENKVYFQFIQENNLRLKMLGLLQEFLLNYDDTNSSFYREGITEYENRRKSNNQWIDEQIGLNKALFAGSMLGFHKVPDVAWTGDETTRKQSLRDNYFSGMDFSDPLIIRTSGMKQWMDGYVNLFGELAASVPSRDSLFTLAGKTAIEKARKGDPLVYGWMVDYFFNGYESFNIEKGIKMLEPYLKDPKCLTTKRQEINRRLEGMKSLVKGSTAPDIDMTDSENSPFRLSTYQGGKNYILILFWSADCVHCKEATVKLYQWYQDPVLRYLLDIVAISLDETALEIEKWKQDISEMGEWTHLRAEEGARSKVATDYFILSVPVMILIDAQTREIIDLPDNIRKLNRLIGR